MSRFLKSSLAFLNCISRKVSVSAPFHSWIPWITSEIRVRFVRGQVPRFPFLGLVDRLRGLCTLCYYFSSLGSLENILFKVFFSKLKLEWAIIEMSKFPLTHPAHLFPWDFAFNRGGIFHCPLSWANKYCHFTYRSCRARNVDNPC